MSAYGPWRALFASLFPSRVFPSRASRLWIATALIIITISCGTGSLQTRANEIVAVANSAAVAATHLVVPWLSELLTIADSVTIVSETLRCEPGMPGCRGTSPQFRDLNALWLLGRNRLSTQFRYSNEMRTGTLQVSITSLRSVTAFSQVKNKVEKETLSTHQRQDDLNVFS